MHIIFLYNLFEKAYSVTDLSISEWDPRFFEVGTRHASGQVDADRLLNQLAANKSLFQRLVSPFHQWENHRKTMGGVLAPGKRLHNSGESPS